jgi:hypothetical protein
MLGSQILFSADPAQLQIASPIRQRFETPTQKDQGEIMKVRKTLLAVGLMAAISPAANLSFAQTAAVNPTTPIAASASTSVPSLVPYSGTAISANGKALSEESGVTFQIYKDEAGGEALWTETQTVSIDPTGHYKVQLGAANPNGLPADLFSTGEARWLEVQIAGQEPQPRTLITSVPYALKAADATTLGGLPASAFALARTGAASNASAGITSDIVSNVTTTGGTAGYLPEFSGATTVVDSPVFVSGANVGIGTATPTAVLDVNGTELISGALTANGGETVGGSLEMAPTATATASTPYNSQVFKLYSSAYNSSTKAVVNPRFGWQARATENDTAAPSGILDLLSSATGGAPAPTGFSFNLNGTVNFATGQTFPGADITGTVSATSVNSANGYNLGGALFAFGSTSSANAYLGFAGNTSSTGGGDTGVGYMALSSNTSGYNNTASGIHVLSSNTTGYDNTASGGVALAVNTTGSGNTASGTYVLQANTSGSFNTASGDGALYSNTSASNNTASGYQALFSNTTGSPNTAIGFQSLYSNTTGTDNVATGYQALYSNTTGYSNTASGDQALYNNTTGYQNTGNGFQMLYNNTTGYQNTGSGFLTLVANTTGANGTAYGYGTLTANTAGYNNSAYGSSVLFNNTTGNDNTAVGDSSLALNTTGNENTAVGEAALQFNSTGSDLTAVGYNADADSSVSTSLSNATALGAHSTVAQSNSLVLGQTTAATPGASYVNVGIGTSTPGSVLEAAVNAPGALGPVLTLTNTGHGESAIDFNSGQPKTDATYTPSARILAQDNGTGSSSIVFQSQASGGLQNNLAVDNAGVHVAGSLDAAANTLKIDHPLDSANRYLVHSAVESSEMVNVYSGNVITDELGLATVKLPDWFQAENTDFRYQLTVIGGRFAQAIVSKEIENNQFTISSNASNVKVSWQVTGLRQDSYAKAHPLVVEQEKPERERGFTYDKPRLTHDQRASAVEKHFLARPAPALNPRHSGASVNPTTGESLVNPNLASVAAVVK